MTYVPTTPLNGDSADDRLGWSVSGAGDVNSDGYNDVIAGAPNDDNNGGQSGSARVYSGFDGSILYTFSGDGAGDNLGWSGSGAGDLAFDGKPLRLSLWSRWAYGRTGQ